MGIHFTFFYVTLAVQYTVFEELFLRLEISARSVETRVYNGSYYEAIRMGVEMSGRKVLLPLPHPPSPLSLPAFHSFSMPSSQAK